MIKRLASLEEIKELAKARISEGETRLEDESDVARELLKDELDVATALAYTKNIDAYQETRAFLLDVHNNRARYMGSEDYGFPEKIYETLFHFAMRNKRDEAVVEVLITGLNSSVPTTRINTIEYLSQIGTPRAIEALFVEAENDEEWEPYVRIIALKTLRDLYNQGAAVSLDRLKQAAESAAKTGEREYDASFAARMNTLRDRIHDIGSHS